jgi:cell division protein FtsB
MDLGWIGVSVVVGLGIVLAFTLQVIRMGIAHEEKRLAMKAGVGDASRLEQIIAANETEIARLRQRVEVLERLATDDERRLTREISGLASDRTTA